MTKGFGLGMGVAERPTLSEDEILDMISTQVSIAFRETIPNLFGPIKTMLIDMFDKSYANVIDVAATTTTAAVTPVGPHGRGATQYQDFANTKPWGLTRSRTQLWP